MTRVGRWTCSMSHAVVADLPVPVAPRRTTSFSPALSREVSSAIAAGWSPEGVYSETTSMGATDRLRSVTGRMAQRYVEAVTSGGAGTLRAQGPARPAVPARRPGRLAACERLGVGRPGGRCTGPPGVGGVGGHDERDEQRATGAAIGPRDPAPGRPCRTSARRGTPTAAVADRGHARAARASPGTTLGSRPPVGGPRLARALPPHQPPGRLDVPGRDDLLHRVPGAGRGRQRRTGVLPRRVDRGRARRTGAPPRR